MVAVLRRLQERGVLGAPAQANLLFGSLATAQADLPTSVRSSRGCRLERSGAWRALVQLSYP